LRSLVLPRPACGEPKASVEGVRFHRLASLFAERAPHPSPLPASAGRGRSAPPSTSLRGAKATKQSILPSRGEMDCLASLPLAMTEERAQPPSAAVIPRESGVSSTPRLIDSITAASGILDHPPSRVMTTGYVFAISRRDCARGLHEFCPSEARGRREDRVRAAPAVSHARCTKQNAHEHTGSAETLRPSLRNGFTAYNGLSPVTGLFCHRRSQEASPLKNLTPASGRQDHTTSPYALARSSRAPPRPSHPASRFVTIAHTPLL
jgi:hypothetical protein